MGTGQSGEISSYVICTRLGAHRSRVFEIGGMDSNWIRRRVVLHSGLCTERITGFPSKPITGCRTSWPAKRR